MLAENELRSSFSWSPSKWISTDNPGQTRWVCGKRNQTGVTREVVKRPSVNGISAPLRAEKNTVDWLWPISKMTTTRTDPETSHHRVVTDISADSYEYPLVLGVTISNIGPQGFEEYGTTSYLLLSPSLTWPWVVAPVRTPVMGNL